MDLAYHVYWVIHLLEPLLFWSSNLLLSNGPGKIVCYQCPGIYLFEYCRVILELVSNQEDGSSWTDNSEPALSKSSVLTLHLAKLISRERKAKRKVLSESHTQTAWRVEVNKIPHENNILQSFTRNLGLLRAIVQLLLTIRNCFSNVANLSERCWTNFSETWDLEIWNGSIVWLNRVTTPFTFSVRACPKSRKSIKLNTWTVEVGEKYLPELTNYSYK